jgi:hypothetical protein
LRHNFKLKAGIASIAILSALAVIAPGSASAKCTTGGMSPAAIDVCTPTAKAKLLDNGQLIPPKSAPPRVKAVIAAANKISSKPYIYGGGHARWWDKGYDCSGAVSFALRGGSFLESPLPSGPMEKFGLPGEGRWITTYANPGHAYAVIAGYRWDTSGDSSGTGPRWHEDLRDNVGYVARHPAGYRPQAGQSSAPANQPERLCVAFRTARITFSCNCYTRHPLG